MIEPQPRKIQYSVQSGADITWRVQSDNYHNAYVWQHRSAFVLFSTFIAYRYY